MNSAKAQKYQWTLDDSDTTSTYFKDYSNGFFGLGNNIFLYHVYPSELFVNKHWDIEICYHPVMVMGLNFFTNEGRLGLEGKTSDFKLKQPNSVNYLIQIARTRVNLYKHKLSLYTWFELDFQSYKFRRGVTLNPDSENFAYTISSPNPFRRNKLSMTYLNIPILLSYKFGKGAHLHSFHASVGGYVGKKISSNTKQRDEDFDKTKIYDNFHLERFQYGLKLQIGYGQAQFLYCRYGLSDLFRDNVGAPNLRNLMIGCLRVF